jgi:hypothetical protein
VIETEIETVKETETGIIEIIAIEIVTEIVLDEETNITDRIEIDHVIDLKRGVVAVAAIVVDQLV